MKTLLIAFALAAPAAASASVREIVAAERAFAAHAEKHGVANAFQTYIADDGLLFVPDPKPGKALLARAPSRPGTLRWWPIYAGAARSGDLGFSTGPYVADDGKNQRYGQFFTIWKKQPDGSWRWLIDHGTPSGEAAPQGPETAPRFLSAEPAVRAEPTDAWQRLKAREQRLDQDLARDARAAYLSVLCPDGRVMRAGPQPASGRAAYLARLDEGPATVRASHIGGGISNAGDLAYTYGNASWPAADGEVRGHYVRVWQNRAQGWVLVVDELVPAPPPPPKPAG